MERYEAYKDSGVEWTGEIPEGWHVVPLKSAFTFGKGLPITKADLSETGKPVISYGQIHSKNSDPAHIKSELVKFVSPSYLETNPESVTRKGDFLFADTSEDRAGSGNFVYHDCDDLIFAGYHTLILRPINPSYGRFLSYLFQDDGWRSQVRSRAGGVKLFSLTLKIITSTSILLPPLDEQRAIADFLDAETARIDGLVADCEREVGLLREYRKAVVSEAVTKGLDPHAPMKDSGVEWIGEIPEGWGVARIKHVASTFGRIGFRGYRSEDLVSAGEGAMTLSPSNMENGELLLDKVSYLSWEKYDESPEIQIEAGDILFTKTGSSYGKTAYVASLPMEATINPQLLAIKDILCNPKFLYYQTCAEWFLLQVAQNVVGGTIPTIAQSKIDNFAICNPPIDEQREIADYLDAKTAEIDGLIEAKRQMAEKLREYRKSLVSEAVTGKFKVPGVA